MELAFANQSGAVSRYWGPTVAAPEHILGRRALSTAELLKIGGGDDGGDCGAGGDCGGDSGSCGDAGCAPADPDAISLPTVTVIGIANPPLNSFTDGAVGFAAAVGTLLGGGIGIVAFQSGAVASMGMGEAVAIGSVLGGIAAISIMGITFTGLALLAVLNNYAVTHPDAPMIGNPMGDPLGGYGGSDGP